MLLYLITITYDEVCHRFLAKKNLMGVYLCVLLHFLNHRFRIGVAY